MKFNVEFSERELEMLAEVLEWHINDLNGWLEEKKMIDDRFSIANSEAEIDEYKKLQERIKLDN